jgi:cell division septal protein FtsQ
MAMVDLRYPNGFAVRLDGKAMPTAGDTMKMKDYR